MAKLHRAPVTTCSIGLDSSNYDEIKYESDPKPPFTSGLRDSILCLCGNCFLVRGSSAR